MIKLTLAIAFLAVFGFVTYALVLLLTRYFKNQEHKHNNNNNQSKNEKKDEQ